MIYLSLGTILIVLGVVANKGGGKHGVYGNPLIAAGIVLLLVSLCAMGSGISVYPRLSALKEEAVSIRNEIESVRRAHYRVKSGYLVGGSLDNMQQSKTLSEYIISYAKLKAKYNSRLKNAQVRRHYLPSIVFGDGAFISSKVDELDKIE